MRLVLVRHGDTFLPGESPRWLGLDSDPELAPQAQEQAQRVRSLLATEGLVPQLALAGPLRRHQDFARLIVQGTDLQISVEPRLQELDYGSWSGKEQHEILETEELAAWNERCIWPNKAAWPRSESEIVAELNDLIAELYKTSSDKTVLLVSSNGRLRILAKQYLSPDWPDRSLKLKTGHCGLLTVSDDKRVILFWNR